MYKKNNRTCAVCGTVYTYCPSCYEFYNHPKWMLMFDEKNCLDIYYITTDYSAGIISKDEAAERVMQLDLSKLEDFKDSIKKVVTELKEYYQLMHNNDLPNEEVKETEETENPSVEIETDITPVAAIEEKQEVKDINTESTKVQFKKKRHNYYKK